MQRSFRSLSDAGARLSSSIFNVRNAAIAAAGVGGLAVLTRRAIESTAELGELADMAGVSAETLQELRHAAKEVGVGMDALVDGFKELQLRADEFATTGKGTAAEAFQRLGMSRDEVQERLQQPSVFLKEIVSRVKNLNQAAQIRVFDELFGGQAGEQFVRFLRLGADGIERFQQRARELGIVISNEMVARSRKANAELETMGDVFRIAGTNLALEFMPLIRDLADLMTDPEFHKGVRDFGQNMRHALEFMVNNSDEIIRVIGAIAGMRLGKAIGGTKGAMFGGLIGLAGPNIDWKKLAKDLGVEFPELSQRGAGSLPANRFAPLGSVAGRAAAGVSDRGSGLGGTGTGIGTGELSDFQKVKQNLELERDLIGATNEERQVANMLKRAGVDIDSDRGRQIATLIGQINEETERMRKLGAVTETVAFGMEDAFSQFIETGKFDFKDMVNSMIKDLARLTFRMQVIEPLMRNMQSAFAGGGRGAPSGTFAPIGSIVGSLVGGFARGGSFKVGGAGGLDSQLISMRITPGEVVSVDKDGKGRGGGDTLHYAPVFAGMKPSDRVWVKSQLERTKQEAVRMMQKQRTQSLKGRSDAIFPA